VTEFRTSVSGHPGWVLHKPLRVLALVTRV